MARPVTLALPGYDVGWFERIGGAGLVSGLAMGLIMMIHATAVGTPFWSPLQMIANTFPAFQDAQMGWQPTAVFTGLAIHMIFSIGWALAYALVAPRFTSSKGGLVAYGLITGIVAYLIMMFLVVPIFNPTMWSAPQGWLFSAHLVFGLVLGLFGAAEQHYLLEYHPKHKRVA